MTDLQIYLAGLSGQLLEAAPVDLTSQTIKRLKPNQWVKVYHGTDFSSDTKYGPQNLVYGIDAVASHSRLFNQGRHSGLFVAPSLKGTGRFGNLVFEIAARTNNLHGVTYGGVIGRSELRGDQKTKDWLKGKFPDSFRPRLSDTLLNSNEPQALLKGLVSPRNILAVHYRGKRYTRKDFIEAFKDKLRPTRGSLDPASTKMSVDDVLGMLAKEFRMDKSKVMGIMQSTMDRSGEEGVVSMLGPDGAGLLPTAAEAMAKKIIARLS